MSILLRPEPRLERQQWAVAHEIGEHAACRVFAQWGVDPRETGRGAREAVANALAGRLLLPTAWFAADAAATRLGPVGLKARYATASHELIARRMLECPPPVIVTFSTIGAISFRRSNLPGRVPPPSAAEMACWRDVHRGSHPLRPAPAPASFKAGRSTRRDGSGRSCGRRWKSMPRSGDLCSQIYRDVGRLARGRRVQGCANSGRPAILLPCLAGGLPVVVTSRHYATTVDANPPHVALVVDDRRLHTDWFSHLAAYGKQERGESLVSDHSVVASKLDAVFYPQSIAVVGASTRPGTVGNDIFRNLLYAEFNGSVYPVNPKAKAILGRACLRHAGRHSRPGGPGRADRAGRGRAGRGRSGDRQGGQGIGGDLGRLQGDRARRGRAGERKLRDKVRAAGIPLIGPNCLGVINTDPNVRMNAAFGRKMPARRQPGLPLPKRRACAPRCWTMPRSGRWASASSSASATRPTSTRSTCWTIWPRTRRPR